MIKRFSTGLIVLAAALGYAGNAGAVMITGDSLHGSTGELTVVGNVVTWSINTTGFDDQDAISTSHTFLTEVAFKISGVTDVALVDPTVGTLYYPSNVNSGSGGCNTGGSKAKFACVTLDPKILATDNQVFSVAFTVVGDADLDGGFSFRGKYGDGDSALAYTNGWVISEEGPVIPEPSAALVFAVGAVILGGRSRRS